MYNVKDLPAGLGLSNAYGEGEHEESQRLEAMFNARLSPLYFPPSRYLLENTLTIPEKTGYHVIGSGLARPLPQGSPGEGAESVLVWGGGTGEPYGGLAILHAMARLFEWREFTAGRADDRFVVRWTVAASERSAAGTPD